MTETDGGQSPEGRSAEIEQSLTAALEKARSAHADLSFALLEAQGFSSEPEKIPGYAHALILYQVIGQGLTFDLARLENPRRKKRS